jgi:acetyltransferase-like isoleucine patch superfamily enzyme
MNAACFRASGGRVAVTLDIHRPVKRALVRGWQITAAIGRAIYLRVRFPGRAVRVHRTTWVSRRSTVRVCGGGSIRIGRNCEIHPFSMVLTYGGDIEIGDNCSVNPFTIIYGHGGVRIGSGVRIAAHCVIIPANHNPGTDELPLYRAGISRKAIAIDDNVWLGAGARILAGVRIARNSIVAAGSVVTKSVPASVTVAGVPARVIDRR